MFVTALVLELLCGCFHSLLDLRHVALPRTAGGMCKLKGSYPILVLIYLMIEDQGTAERPVVTFTPDFKKILIGERITMACNAESASPTCSWYHNNIPVHTGETYVIPSAEMRHGGDYHCQTGDGDTSEIVTLNVTDGLVILQAPLYVYEGDDVSLRCHTPLGYPTRQSVFYRNNQTIQATDSDLLPIKYTDLTATYRCSKQVLTPTNNTYSAETMISYTLPEKDSVIFTPDWNKLLTGENITMTFSKGSGIKYLWHKDNNKVGEGRSYTIPSAQAGHSGIYQCRTTYGVSDEFRLDVTDGPVILQAPVLVYKGHDLALRCHSRPGDRVIRTTFYKDGDVIQPLPRDPGMVIIPTDKKQEGRYRCERTLSQEEYVTYTDEESLHIRELFLKPNLSTELHPAVEGDHMTLTCNTSLRPHRPRTQLESAFYRDGKEVKTFSSLNQYDVHSAQLEDSGKYSCDVRTPTGSVRKRSAELYIQIEDLFPIPNITVIPNPATVHSHMTLTCDKSLSPLRPGTQLQFAFYRDGSNVQEFGSSNQYGVQSALLGDSGNYSCEVRTPTYSVNRRSQKISVQIKDYPSNTTTAIVAGLVSTTLLIILILGIVLVKKKFTSDEKRQTTGHQEAASPRGASEQADVFYTEIQFTREVPAASSASDEDSCYVNYTANQTASLPKVTENVVYSMIKPRTDP